MTRSAKMHDGPQFCAHGIDVEAICKVCDHMVLSPGVRTVEDVVDHYIKSSKPARHPNSARFHELVEQIADLHDRKQTDYGKGDDPFANVRASLEFGIPPWVGALVRLNDKVVRLKNFARKGTLANESAEDSMRDIAVYALIALVLYEQESKNDRKI